MKERYVKFITHHNFSDGIFSIILIIIIIIIIIINSIQFNNRYSDFKTQEINLQLQKVSKL